MAVDLKKNYEYSDFVEKVQEIAKENGVDEQKFLKSLLQNYELVNLYDKVVQGFSFGDVLDMFNPTVQKIYVKDIVCGTRADLKTNVLESMASIGRNGVIYKHLDNVSAEFVISSLQTTECGFFEHDGKIYLSGDGNHRLLQLKFLYELEKQKVKSKSDQEKLDEKFSFEAPLIHTNHSQELLMAIRNLKEKSLASKFITVLEKRNKQKESSVYKFVKYNKNSNTYSINYQGVEKHNLTEKEAISLLNQLNKDRPYRIYKNGEKYDLEYGNILKLGLTKQQVEENIEKILKNPKQNSYCSDYRIVQKENGKYDLLIDYIRYHGPAPELGKIYSSAIFYSQPKTHQEVKQKLASKDFEIFGTREIEEMSLDNMSIADFNLDKKSRMGNVTIYGREITDLSKEELLDRISLLEKERTFLPLSYFTLENKVKLNNIQKQTNISQSL